MSALEVCVGALAAAYPRTVVGTRTIQVYVQFLSDLPAEEVERTTKHLIETSPFFPTVAEIRTATIERRLGLPTHAEAMRQLGQGRVRDDFHPLVWEARQAVGDSWAWRHSDSPSVLVGQARKVYEDLRHTAIEEAVSPPSLPAVSAPSVELVTATGLNARIEPESLRVEPRP
jgi:hypothetical protein